MDSTETTCCAVCGSDVETQEWHPAAIDEVPGGDIRVREFCSEDCRAEWEEADQDVAAADL